MIPKILHQIWLGPDEPPQKLMDGWRDKHPAWEYCVLNAPLPTKNMVNMDLYDRARTWVQKSDILRYEILATYGGVYIDADTECLRPIDDLCQGESWLVYENEVARPGLIVNGMMGASNDTHPTSAFYDYACLILQNKGVRWDYPPWQSTGPGFITRCWHDWPHEKPAVHPSHYFLPYHFTGSVYQGTGPVYGIHHWHSTRHGLH